MTINEAKSELRRFGISLKKTPHGEFRVNFAGGSERTAYYTTDLHDAIDTGRAMATFGSVLEPSLDRGF